jgi:[acyl-carrier-protein] S-malonyltransferase
MGLTLCDAFPDLKRRYFERSDELLGFALSQLCFHGPEAELTRTENAQPALLLVSVATWEALRERGIHADAVAGHSLGEYSALVAAGALAFEDALKVVRRRGELMARVGGSVQGGMAAVMGLPSEAVEAICRQASEAGVVQIANYNSPEQSVISGEQSGVERAIALARERGAGRVLPLNLSTPFHCSLMAPLRDEMAAVLAGVEVRPPQVPIVANINAGFVRTPDEIRRALSDQVAGAVRWMESIWRLSDAGITRFVEVGPGRVLSGLTRRIIPAAESVTYEQFL